MPPAPTGVALPELSVVVPVYNEAGNAAALAREIREVMIALRRPFEILFINDGSDDSTLEVLRGLLEAMPELRIVDLDGNFGEAAALCAGFEAARGQVVITLDGDGQNDPRDIPALLAKLEQGSYRAVSGWRRRRHEDLWRRVLPSRLANAMIAAVTRLPVHDNGCGLKVYRLEVVGGVRLPRGFNRFMPAIFGVRRGEVAEVEVNDRRRQYGESHYGFERTLIVARDLLALPFLLMQPRWTERVAAGLTVAAVVVHAVGIGVHAPALLMPSGIVAPIGAMIWWNARRFNAAQRDGVFRVRREYGGAVDTVRSGEQVVA